MDAELEQKITAISMGMATASIYGQELTPHRLERHWKIDRSLPHIKFELTEEGKLVLQKQGFTYP